MKVVANYWYNLIFWFSKSTNIYILGHLNQPNQLPVASLEIGNRYNFYRLLSVISALIVPVIGLVINSNYPDLHDPITLRLILSGWLIFLIILSYSYTAFLKVYLKFLYFTVIGAIVWSNYLLGMNELVQSYAFLTFLTLITCSLIIDESRMLKNYILFFGLVTTLTILISDASIFDKGVIFLELLLVCLLAFVAISRFIKTSKDLSLINSNFKTLLDNIDASLFLIREDYSIIETNERARDRTGKLFGKEVEAGDDIRNMMPTQELMPFEKSFEKVLKGKSIEFNHKLGLCNSIPKWYKVKMIPIFDERTQQVNNVLFIIRDIDKEKKKEEAVERNNQELKKVNAELDSFLYRSTHDLRAPLTSILGLINVCKLENEPQIHQQHLDLIKTSVLRLDNLISDILDYSKNSNAEIKNEFIDFRKIVTEVFDTHKTMDYEEKIEKIIAVDPDLEFRSDYPRLTIILNNLVANAFKYHTPDKENAYIKVSVGALGEEVLINVEDNGQGIDPEHIDKIFDIFFRAHHGSQGSGLGLYIVNEAISKLNGTIEVLSTLHKGSKFQIRLPKERAVPVAKDLEKDQSPRV